MVKACKKQAGGGKKKEESDEHEDAGIINLLVGMELSYESAQAHEKNQRDQDQDDAQAQYDVVDEPRQKTQPEPCVFHARHGGVSAISGNGCHASCHPACKQD